MKKKWPKNERWAQRQTNNTQLKMSIRAYNKDGERVATGNWIAKHNCFRQFYPTRVDYPTQNEWQREWFTKDPTLTFSVLDTESYLARQMKDKLMLDPEQGRPLDQWAQEEGQRAEAERQPPATTYMDMAIKMDNNIIPHLIHPMFVYDTKSGAMRSIVVTQTGPTIKFTLQ